MKPVAFSTTDISHYYDFAVPTVRNWAIEFSEYLSPSANPGQGKQRSFTVEDLTVIDLVATYKRRQVTYDDIHLALKAGQRGDAPNITEQELKALSATEGEKRASLEIQVLQRSILDLRQQLHEAGEKAAKVDQVVQENVKLQTLNTEVSRQRDGLQQRYDEAMQQLQELNRQLGREYAAGFKDGLKESRGVSNEDGQSH